MSVEAMPTSRRFTNDNLLGQIEEMYRDLVNRVNQSGEVTGAYLRVDGTVALGGAWDMGSQPVTNVNIDTGDIAVAVTNTEWDAAYSHSIDNSQAHTDYLLNNASDETSGTLTAAGFTTDGVITDGVLSISDGSIASAVNGTFSGTVQAEQLTSTDDITMEGHLLTMGDVISDDTSVVLRFLGKNTIGTITYDPHAVADEFHFGISKIETDGDMIALNGGFFNVIVTGGIFRSNTVLLSNAGAFTGITFLDVDTLNLDGNAITDSTGTISFDNEHLTTTGTGTFGEIIDNGLTASLGVYTDASKQLTSTPPSTGTLGYWTRSETPDTLTTATAGDDVTTTGLGTFGALTVPDGDITLTQNGKSTVISRDNTNMAITVDSGTINFKNLASANTTVNITPVATKKAILNLDGVTIFSFDASQSQASGISGGTHGMQYFGGSLEGNTPTFRIGGFPTGETLDWLDIEAVSGAMQLSTRDGIISTPDDFIIAADNKKLALGAAGATDSYLQWDGANLDLYSSSGIFDFVSGGAGFNWVFTTTGSNGSFVWSGTSDYFRFNDDVLMGSAENIYFRDTAIGVYSQADSFLDIFADGAVRIGDSSAGAPTNYTSFDPDGSPVFVGTAGLSFAEIYAADAADTITIDAMGKANYKQILSFMANGVSNNMTPDHTNDHITVVNAGMYLCTVSLHMVSVGGGGADNYGYSVYKNNGATEFTNLHGQREMSLSGIIDCPAPVSATRTTYAFVDSGPDTITDSSNNFINDGFVVGHTITISGSTSNDGDYTIDGVAAGTLTLIAADTLTAEIAGDTVTATGSTTVEVWIWNNTNADDVIIDDINLSLVQVGGT